MSHQCEVGIIGAGITGLYLARELNKLNIKNVILEKSRGIGGRISTRRLGSSFVNQGLTHFEAQHESLQHLAHEAMELHFLINENQTFYSSTSINQWMKHLAKDLEIKLETQVYKIVHEEGSFKVSDQSGQDVLKCQKIIFTSPAPQTFDILERSEVHLKELKDVSYNSQINFYFLDSTLSPRLTDLFHPPIEHHGLLWARMREEFLNDFIDWDKDKILNYFIEHYQLKPELSVYYVHKWKYSTVKKSIAKNFQFPSQIPGLYLAGDYFEGDGLNAAIKSADLILNKFIVGL